MSRPGQQKPELSPTETESGKAQTAAAAKTVAVSSTPKAISQPPLVSAAYLNFSLLALTIALAAVVLTAYVAKVILEAIPHVQDDVTYLFQARIFALGRLWVPAWPVPEAFEQEFIVNFAGHAFGKYPPGHPLMLLPGVLAGVPWLINPLQGGLAVFVIYLIGRKVYGPGSGLLAALLLAASPFFIFMSGSMMAHPTGLLFLSLFVLAFVHLDTEDPDWRYALGAGLALGFAFLARPWTAIAAAVPFGGYAFYRASFQRPAFLADDVALPARVRTLRSRVTVVVDALRGYLPLLIGLAPFVLVLLVWHYVLTGDPLKNPMELWWPFDKIGFGEGVGIRGAHSVQDGLYNTYLNLAELNKHLYGWPAYLTLAFAFVPFIALRARRWDWLLLAGWLALVLAQIAWWADGIMYGPRYYYETIGLLVLLTARGAGVLADLSAKSIRGGRIIGYLLVLALIGYNIAFYLPAQFALHRGYNYVSAAPLRAVESANVHDALVFVETGEWYAWWNYGAVFSANSPTLDGDVVFAKDRGRDRNLRVAALYPDRRYYRLSGNTVQELRLP